MTDTTEDTKKTKRVREPKKNSISMSEVELLTDGLPSYKKAAFLVLGHKDGVRLAVPLTNGVSRAYFYGMGDYTLIPSHESINVLSEEKRKEDHLGGIMAEVSFANGVDSGREAFKLLVDVVKNAPVPAKKELKKPKAPRKAKAVPTANTSEKQADAVPAQETEDSAENLDA